MIPTKIPDILFPEPLLRARVQELGAQISHEFQGTHLSLVTVLKGGFVFLADLIRELDLDLTVDFMAISKYQDSAGSSGSVGIEKDLDDSITNRHVLLVEDIIDTGLTMNYLLGNLKAREPASISICSLLDRPKRRLADIDIRYVGFDVPDLFVVGYGLDHNGLYRNLPYVGILDPGDIDWSSLKTE